MKSLALLLVLLPAVAQAQLVPDPGAAKLGAPTQPIDPGIHGPENCLSWDSGPIHCDQSSPKFIGILIVTVMHHVTCTDFDGKKELCSYSEPMALYVGEFSSLDACDREVRAASDSKGRPSSAEQLSTIMCVPKTHFAWPK